MRPDRQTLYDVDNLVFFGVGVSLVDSFQQLLLIIGRNPDFLCDNAPEKWGREYSGVACISPEQLQRLKGSTAVVITVRRYEFIYRQLRELGLQDIYVACFDQGFDLVGDIKRIDAQPYAGATTSQCISVAEKWTFVTGASRGIGRQISFAMAKLGSNLIIHGRKLEHLHDVAGSCSNFGVQVRSIAADLGSEIELERMLDDLEQQHPPIDIVFNNAGISLPNSAGPWNISDSDYQAHYAVNTIAPIRICYRLIPPMIKRGFGRVVNVSSTIQKRPGEMAYACSKAALNKFVHDLAPSLVGTGVMLSLVCPGYVQSDMGGPTAPHPVESVIPGVLLGALLDGDCNGRWFIAQDYAGLDLTAAASKVRFYYSMDQGD